MEKCDFDWSLCVTCANARSSLCPLENNPTIKNLKREIQDLEYRLNNLESNK